MRDRRGRPGSGRPLRLPRDRRQARQVRPGRQRVRVTGLVHGAEVDQGLGAAALRARVAVSEGEGLHFREHGPVPGRGRRDGRPGLLRGPPGRALRLLQALVDSRGALDQSDTGRVGEGRELWELPVSEEVGRLVRRADGADEVDGGVGR